MSAVTTQLQIYNLALSNLGSYRVTTLDAQTKEADVCNLRYEPARDQLLRDEWWNCARKSLKIGPVWVAMGSVADLDGEIKVHKTAHGRTTGERITVKDTEADGTYDITVVDVDNFTLDDSTWNSGVVAGSYTVSPPFGYTYLVPLPDDCIAPRKINGVDADMASAEWETEGRLIVTNEPEVSLVYTKVPAIADMDSHFMECLIMKLTIELAVPITGALERRTKYLQEFESVTLPKASESNAIEKRSRVIPREAGSPSLMARYGGSAASLWRSVGYELPRY